ncbi:MAG: methyltransferase domain-containing protein [Beijerinckiaceae bacterium]|nr:methyltransferase domain-containing protein [Beijerinckiaceae bacterium]
MSATSGDLLADRRYAWGAGAFKERDFEGAADLFRQVIEIAPEWAPAHLSLGDSLMGLGDRAGAQIAWGHALRLDASGVLGAALKIAALGAGRAPAAAPREYVRALFDEYAPRFDTHLREKLAYRGPELILAAIERACGLRGREFWFDRALDLGCGTGLMADELWKRVDSMNGCDLSPVMIEGALLSGKYSNLRVADVGDYLVSQGEDSSDLVVAADVFVYIGDLEPLFAQSARVIERGGLFAFSVQRAEGAEWSVGADLRYAHSRAYLGRLASKHGFEVAVLDDASTRKDAGVDVPGLVAVLART